LLLVIVVILDIMLLYFTNILMDGGIYRERVKRRGGDGEAT